MTTSLPGSWHVEHLKLVGYLLNLDHPIGRPKARVFLDYGFAPDSPESLAEALFEHAATTRFCLVETETSTRFVFEGPMRSPGGLMPRVRSVWMSSSDGTSARLLTAYPFDER